MQHVDRVIAATEDERKQMICYCGATPGQVAVIPCGVDLKLFVPREQQKARAALGLRYIQLLLLFVGRLDPFKGPDVLLRTEASMQEKAQIVIVGGKLPDDQELQQLRKLAAELKLSQRVHFLGARPQSELPTIYSAADITVVPSYHESFGMAAVELLACGTPVVATRAGGLMTVVRHGETGYLVPRCPGFFAERLDALLQTACAACAYGRSRPPFHRSLKLAKHCQAGSTPFTTNCSARQMASWHNSFHNQAQRRTTGGDDAVLASCASLSNTRHYLG